MPKIYCQQGARQPGDIISESAGDFVGICTLETQVKIHLPSSAPEQAIFAMLLDRLPRLVT